MNFSFLALILTLLGMAFLTSWNKHVLFLMAVSTGLWATMIWLVLIHYALVRSASTQADE